MSLLYYINNRLWRKLPNKNRRKLMGLLEHLLPSSLFQKILGAAGSGIYRQEVLDSGVLFIHIPKAAGTAITTSLYALGGVGHYRAIDARAQNPELFEQLYRFAVTRNPWERLLSSYRFAQKGGTKEVPLFNSRNLISEIPDTFEKFVLDWLIHQDPEKLHPIFTPQYMFVCDEAGKIIVDDIFEMNNIAPVESELSKRLSREVIIHYANVTGSEKLLAEAYSNKEVVEAVAKFYQRDVALFDYKCPVTISPH